jgi:putative transcriptional regulator
MNVVGCIYLFQSTVSMAKRKYNRIKAILAEQGKLNKELAALLDLSERTVSRWSTNGRQLSVEMLYEIAKVLKIEVRELLVASLK